MMDSQGWVDAAPPRESSPERTETSSAGAVAARPSARAAERAGAILALQRSAGNATVARMLSDRATPQRTDSSAQISVQRYRLTRDAGGGNMVGEPSGCHCHIDIGKPHFKVGTDDSSRINFGRDMNLSRMQRAYETLLSKYQGSPGFDDCKEYLEEQGCEEVEGESLIDTLKGMLITWGGLSDDEISFYTDAAGNRETIAVEEGQALDAVILENEDQIRESDNIYADFLEAGGVREGAFDGIDEDEMHAEQTLLYEKERRAAQRANR